MVCRCNLAEVEEDMAWLAYAWDLCEIWCLCEFVSLGGALGGFIYAAS
jgi:hypothetical protein